MRSNRFLLALSLSVCLTATAGCGRLRTDDSVWPSFDSVNGSNALARVVRLVEISPRDAGTPGAAYAAQWIAQELRGIGLRPVADAWQEETAGGRMQFSNVYAEIPGSSSEVIVLGSHFDTKSGIGEGFQGANDSGSSTALLIELARVLKESGISFRRTVRFAFFDGEECRVSYRSDDGLHGSRRMATVMAAEQDKFNVAAVIVLDMVGDRDLGLVIPRNVTPWLARMALDAASAAGYPQLHIARGAILDDHWPFVERGMPAINVIDFEYGSAPGKNDYWHTMEDTVDKLSPESLTITGKIVMQLLYLLEKNAGE